MKKFLNTIWGKLCLSAAIALVLAALLLGGYALWHWNLPKFKDATIELGEELPSIEAFLTEHAKAKNAVLLNEKDLSLDRAGAVSLDFVHNGKEETVTLFIVDTTAPTAVFKDLTVDINTPLRAEDFVEEYFDLSNVTISFVTPPEPSEDYSDSTVQVKLTDESGNSIVETCTVHYKLLLESYDLELGQTLTVEDILLDPEKNGQYINQEEIDTVNASPVGVYTITVKDSVCTVTVKDTTPPELKLKAIVKEKNDNIKLSDFIVTAEDASGDVITEFITEVNSNSIGTFTVEIQATDVNGNKTVAQTTLKVINDGTPPVFTGLKDITVPKGTAPDYTKGVSAKDAKDGTVNFTYDASKVDITKPGTYYVTYTAKDSWGNAVSKRRKVTVNHNAEDTAALVLEVASGLTGDVLALRDYVRNSIRYSSSWGGEDPVWYGFKNRSGNCYVHALCLDALLKNKGYETMLIWVTDKSHYWNLVKINGVWRHIDSTPATQHSKFNNPMTDEERLSCLSGRDWDRTKWPECK